MPAHCDKEKRKDRVNEPGMEKFSGRIVHETDMIVKRAPQIIGETGLRSSLGVDL